MPTDLVLVVLESNGAVTVVGHNDVGLVIGQERALAATAIHNSFDWLYRTAQVVHLRQSGAQAPFNRAGSVPCPPHPTLLVALPDRAR